jgi:murein DD-endopeptidase MepM/ murein hydrolase activator NlpD
MRRLSLLVVSVVAVVALVLAPSVAARSWERPVDGAVLRLFAVGPDRFAAGQHRGVDLAAAPGERVRAACGGRVSFAGRVPRGGLTVSVRCGRLVATYQHLGAVGVRRSQVVVAGARIGTVGSARPRPHVHLGARERATGAYVDPLALLAGGPRTVRPPLPVARRPLPLGPAPQARRPLRRPAPARAPRRPPAVARATPAAPHQAPAPVGRLPWLVWLGFGLFGLGLPLGGLVRVRERRRHAGAAARMAS